MPEHAFFMSMAAKRDSLARCKQCRSVECECPPDQVEKKWIQFAVLTWHERLGKPGRPIRSVAAAWARLAEQVMLRATVVALALQTRAVRAQGSVAAAWARLSAQVMLRDTVVALALQTRAVRALGSVAAAWARLSAQVMLRDTVVTQTRAVRALGSVAAAWARLSAQVMLPQLRFTIVTLGLQTRALRARGSGTSRQARAPRSGSGGTSVQSVGVPTVDSWTLCTSVSSESKMGTASMGSGSWSGGFIGTPPESAEVECTPPECT